MGRREDIRRSLSFNALALLALNARDAIGVAANEDREALRMKDIFLYSQLNERELREEREGMVSSVLVRETDFSSESLQERQCYCVREPWMWLSSATSYNLNLEPNGWKRSPKHLEMWQTTSIRKTPVLIEVQLIHRSTEKLEAYGW